MRKITRHAATLASATLLLAAGIAPAYASEAAASERSASSCYSNAFTYASASGTTGESTYPEYNYLQVRGWCNDINIKTNYSRYVRVCGTTWCGDWYPAYAGQWTVIHHNSVTGAYYYVVFRGDNTSTGMIAD